MIFFYLLVLAITLAVISEPFWSEQAQIRASDFESQSQVMGKWDAEFQREMLRKSLEEAQTDREMGKISAEEYQNLETEILEEGARLMKEQKST